MAYSIGMVRVDWIGAFLRRPGFVPAPPVPGSPVIPGQIVQKRVFGAATICQLNPLDLPSWRFDQITWFQQVPGSVDLDR